MTLSALLRKLSRASMCVSNVFGGALTRVPRSSGSCSVGEPWQRRWRADAQWMLDYSDHTGWNHLALDQSFVREVSSPDAFQVSTLQKKSKDHRSLDA